MTPSLLACTWLLLPFCILITLSTGDLEFYQDVVPETSENMALKQLARYLENHHQRGLHRSHFPPLLMHPARKKHHLELDREKENILEALADKSNLNEMLRKQKLNPWNYHERVPYSINKVPTEKEFELPYYNLNPMPRVLKYPDYKLRYMNEESNQKQSSNFKNIDLLYPRMTPLSSLSFDERDIIRGMKEEPISEFHEKYAKTNERSSLQEMEQPSESMPKFSFHFDNANLKDKHPFAVKSNDPRYYQNTPFSLDNDDDEESSEQKPLENGMKWEQETLSTEEKMPVKLEANTQNVQNVKYHKLEDATTLAFSEPERRMEYHPLIVPVNHSLNNDIYFIAIVAGCSAAAMFALVLISLTWCRLQRGAKAAADIEYPAYGITGPNKDVSPSSDQRLAQSAQMYHFQHQKQQIIAMENRTAATRDPGSVSEAESDEENEEGDYTVYECPGLASTGEMEVKNPLFHDDPTPATPAQTNKEEDHI